MDRWIARPVERGLGEERRGGLMMKGLDWVGSGGRMGGESGYCICIIPSGVVGERVEMYVGSCLDCIRVWRRGLILK